MKRFLSVLLCAVFVLLLMPATFQTASAESLTHFNIRLDEPIATLTPDFDAEFNTDVYMYTTVTWQENSPGFNMKLNMHDEFRAGLAYKVVIWVRLSDGYSFATDPYGDLAAAITVNNKAISSLKIENRDSEGQITEVTITCEYDPLPGREIDKVLITGVPTPVAGNMPIYSFSLGSDSYGFYNTEPVVWYDKTNNYKTLDSSDTFIQGHEYQLCIWLYANRESGFTFKTDQYGNPQVDATINSWAADRVNKAYEQDGREVIELLYTFPPCPAAHTCAPRLVPLQKQTCVLPGFKAYYECSCGKTYEDAAGTKEITDLDGYGIIPADGHKWSPTYLYKNSTGHAWICATCKEHSEIEVHIPGPAATETAPQKCTACDYVIQPVINHTHQLILQPQVKPTCVASGTVAHYACSGCTALFSDAEGKNPLPADTKVIIPPLGHAASDNWSFDDEYHWRTCTNCQEVLTETKTLHDAAAGKCSTCGHTVAEKPEPTETTPTDPGKQEGTPSNSGGWIIAVVVGVLCFGVGIVATVLIIKKKKN